MTKASTSAALRLSRYAQHLIGAAPALADELDPARGPWTRKSMLAFLEEQAPAANRNDEQLGCALRRLRKRVMLRTIARDLDGAPLAEICTVMTTLAEVAIREGLALLHPKLASTHGEPVGESTGTPQKLIVVGMGKLGGGELNVSSDIDLVFVYPEDGETRGGERPLSNHEFFVRLGRKLIGLISAPDAEGWVFRVDMRLRPWGDPGPLAMSFDALENYLVSQGREWERYAWIKGRPLSGDDHAGLDAIVRPFVFRKYLDFGSISAMRELHAEVRAEVARRELAGHVKLGPGGIREIEFIAQALQLIRGGRDAALRERPTLPVLERLAQTRHGGRLLEPETVAELHAAYDFLRRVEHRLQYLDDAQTHELPENEDDRKRVAQSMGFRGWASFMKALDTHRAKVSARFEHIFSAPDESRHALADLWSGASAAPEEQAARLDALGFKAPADTTARLAAIRGGSRYLSLPDASRARFDALMPRLLELAAARTSPDETLERCLGLIESVSRRAAYLALLDEHPQALARVADIASESSWAADYLQRHPIVLDELLDARVLLAPPDWNELGREIRNGLKDLANDPERQMDLVRETHHAQVFRFIAQDIAGALSVERLADHLSDLADLMLQIVIELCWTQLRERFGAEMRPEPQFAVIGYGKLGGKELGYASDLDIIFLYDDDRDSAAEIYSRLGQRINLWLNSRTGAGILFETDLRLRPDGASGLLVSSLEAFRRYQRESAWPWEHQALTRARYCAGEAAVGAAFEQERQHILTLPRDAKKLAADVLEMRKTLLDAHPNVSGEFDVKHDRGGMIDIEFMVQYLVLAHAHRHPALTDNDGNIALLALAAQLGLIPEDLSQTVQDAYREFRRRQHSLRLNGAKYARVPVADVKPHADATLALWKKVFDS